MIEPGRVVDRTYWTILSEFVATSGNESGSTSQALVRGQHLRCKSREHVRCKCFAQLPLAVLRDSSDVDSKVQTLMSTIQQHELFRLLNEAEDRGERMVVATVAHTRGSTPQQRGAKMLFFQNGEVAGTVGGGCIEAEVWAEAREAMRSGKSALHHFSLTAEEASEEGMVCGGTMDIFVEVMGGG